MAEENNNLSELAALVKRLEDANAKAESNLKAQAELIAMQKLSGRSDAGAAIPVQKEETPTEYKNRILGTK